MTIQSRQHILIVGAGEFGSSTAVSLLRTGKYNVTILDRAEVLPAEDAASTDLNKVVRFDYSDEDYAELAWQAIEEWRKPEWEGVYNESGVVILGDKAAGPYNTFAEKAMVNAEKHSTVAFLKTPTEINSRLDPAGTGISRPQAARWGYFNPAGGWAHAEAAVRKLHQSIKELGGTTVPGASIESLVFAGGDVRGVRTTDGREFIADKVIIATGSWTAKLIGDLLPKDIVQATGQVIAAVQLDKAETEKYRRVPVIMAKDGSGFYCFPPNKDGIMKMATSAGGYLTEDGSPRTSLTVTAAEYHQTNNLSWLPKGEEALLRNKFASFYPHLGDRPFSMTRMCFYSDVPGGDWIIDYHPDYPSLLVASGGSGHAFKFLPIIGSLIHQRLENSLPTRLTDKWALRPRSGVDPARATMKPVPLRVDDFAPTQV